ncbi:ribokinase [Halobacillus alkaliphilus]|uniref:Ribokinase n=1 Tax=Halobacillus alkaliphilus TaxID=396056 RepID=A0A1I2KD28_9BACI|nr:ribokinase [Halobacillus alkaliphilus]SFF64962.1 ribokinase [Halobacillus alkaliphilus]
MTKKPKVTVIGSINMDLTVQTTIMPKQGETVLGDNFATYPGGKGANQAVAAARLGADVQMLGAVGNDVFGKDLVHHLQNQGIDTSAIARSEKEATGTATIILSNQDNRIIVAAGANKEVTPSYIQDHLELIKESDIILTQLEIPLETITYLSDLKKDLDVPMILNPAPYQPLPASVIEAFDYLTPNETEAELFKKELQEDRSEEKWITTRGSEGVTIYKDGELATVPGYEVPVEDTTGAGDTFSGALATQLAKGLTIEKAVQTANAAAALSIMKKGAQSGMPDQQQVEQFLRDQGGSSL